MRPAARRADDGDAFEALFNWFERSARLPLAHEPRVSSRSSRPMLARPPHGPVRRPIRESRRNTRGQNRCSSHAMRASRSSMWLSSEADVHLAHRRALDRVRGIVHDVGRPQCEPADSVLREREAALRVSGRCDPQLCERIAEPRVGDERPVGEAACEPSSSTSALAAGKRKTSNGYQARSGTSRGPEIQPPGSTTTSGSAR